MDEPSETSDERVARPRSNQRATRVMLITLAVLHRDLGASAVGLLQCGRTGRVLVCGWAHAPC